MSLRRGDAQLEAALQYRLFQLEQLPRYNDSLLGPYPEAKSVYRERSPIHFTDRLSCPIILFQGLEDKVVPPNQSEMMADAVRKKGLKVKYVTFEGEQHGFRKAENIIKSLEEELAFYRDVFG